MDVIIGGEDAGSAAGRVYIYHGGQGGIASFPTATLTGTDQFGTFGNSISGAGDVNGDGYADIIVGAEDADDDMGRAYLFLGSAAGLVTPPASVLLGADANGFFGGSVSGAGDINGDGFADVIVGEPSFDMQAGRAYVYLGSSTGLNTTPAAILTGPASSSLGLPVGCAGDINGDGYADIIIGAIGTMNQGEDSGSTYVYLGSASGLIESPIIINDPSFGIFGISASAVSDVNGDGFGDLIVGNSLAGDNEAGQAYVYLGNATGIATIPAVTLTGPGPGLSEFGDSLASSGDINGDGIPDFIVGAPGSSSSDAGHAFIYLGAADLLLGMPAAVLTDAVAGGSFGISVAR